MRGYAVETAALLLLFAAATGLASLFGAANLGTASSFGQIAFMAGLLYVLLRR
jgi:hypothetical protein